MKLRTFRIGGIHPEENKLSSEVVTTVAKLPQQAIFLCHSILVHRQNLS